MIKSWYDKAWEDFVYLEAHDKQVYKRIIRLLEDIDRNGYSGIGKPEPLTGNLSGFWSRRIDEKNRIVYTIENDTIFNSAMRFALSRKIIDKNKGDKKWFIVFMWKKRSCSR